MAGGFTFGLGVGAFGLGDEGLAAELELAALFVDADALDPDFLAFADLQSTHEHGKGMAILVVKAFIFNGSTKFKYE